MLPAPYRMRNAEDFRRTVRRGIRAARPTVVVHAGCDAGTGAGVETLPVSAVRPSPQVRIGFVVSKAVGNAVRRNAVKRRLRHLVADRLQTAPAGVRVVVRALPAAAQRPDRLAADLGSAWSSVLSRLDCP